ncbi:hypothetical protein [Euzebya rosea]|uniref:hypothetical protein n=1 Tax=Euzebya rosea TaxID=2052804 RepID=UPI000D3EC443|nr:hypothetical protein [Euzebya rosea]
MTVSRHATRLLLVVAVPLLLAASCEATRDLEGVRAVDPDSAVIIRNADAYPNISILCVEGTGIFTTTREAAPVVIPDSDVCVSDPE